MRKLDISTAQADPEEILQNVQALFKQHKLAFEQRSRHGETLSSDDATFDLYNLALGLLAEFGDLTPTFLENVVSLEKFEHLIEVHILPSALSAFLDE